MSAHGLCCHPRPPHPTPQALGKVMGAELPHVPGGSDVVLYPASVKASTDLQDSLAAAGYKVNRINTYNTVRTTGGATPFQCSTCWALACACTRCATGLLRGWVGGDTLAPKGKCTHASSARHWRHAAAVVLLLSWRYVLLQQVGVTNVSPEALQQALAADVVTFGSPSAVK